ncbi:hypothetical protein Tco_0759301 [Tanacetum coccineum]
MSTKPKFFYDHSSKKAIGFQNPYYLKKAQQLEPKLYDGNVMENTYAIVIPDSEETIMLAEESRSKMLLKQQDPMVLEKKVNTKPVDYNSMNFSDPCPSSTPNKVEVPKELPNDVKDKTTATSITKGMWGFEHTKACFRDEIIPFVKTLKEIFNNFHQYLFNELTEVQNVFHQMEQDVKQHHLDSKTFEVKMTQVLNENDRLLEQVINKDIVNVVMNSSMDNASVNENECIKCLKLETELLNNKDFIEKETYDELFRKFTALEKYCISLEVATQLNQEIFQRDNSISTQIIRKLKDIIKSLSGNANVDKVKMDMDEIETLNIKLDHREKGLLVTALKNDLRKLKGKALVDNVATKHSVDPEMLKIDMEPIAHILQTCPSINNSGDKLVVVTPKNKDKKVRLTEPITYLGNTNTKPDSASNLVSNKPMLSSTGNKVEALPRKVKSSLKNKNPVVELNGTASVQHSKLNANSELICVKCNGCMLFVNNDLCVLNSMNYVNARVKSKSVKKKSKRKFGNQQERAYKLFSSTVKVGNDHVEKIMGYRDYQIGNITISRVYYVEGLGHNLFSVGQFCDSNLEVAFRQHTFFIGNPEGVDH